MTFKNRAAAAHLLRSVVIWAGLAAGYLVWRGTFTNRAIIVLSCVSLAAGGLMIRASGAIARRNPIGSDDSAELACFCFGLILMAFSFMAMAYLPLSG